MSRSAESSVGQGRRTDRPAGPQAGAPGGIRPIDGPVERRRASHSLWAACEALLSAADPRALGRSLDRLSEAFECDGVALYAVGASGALEPWCARGDWRPTPGDLRDCMSIPLFRSDQRVGTLDLQARAGQRWSAPQLTLIRTAAGALGAALGARIELEQLRRQPGRDPVTGLPDASTFHTRVGEELARARRYGLPVAVAVIDLDHFGALNERYGRDSGDAALAEVALMLRLQLRDTDIVARLSGDTFGLLLPETDAGPALRCARRITRAIEEHSFARVGRITVSAGVASGPLDGMESLELIDQADRSLSLAKKSGRRRVVASARLHVN